jgi:5-oxoprolinase (ATP-hydrolysing)
LTITDANLVLGRLLPSHFPHIFGPNENEPLDLDGSRDAFAALTREINAYYQSVRNEGGEKMQRETETIF